ncbi:MAG: endolytic transglycosylase MltG [Elusimicrobiota bacterium]
MTPRPGAKTAIALVLAAGMACVMAWWLRPGSERIRVEVPSGLSAAGTADLLKSRGVIRSVTLFKVFGTLSGFDRSLKPGLYTLRRPMSSAQALWRLHRGRIDPVKVVIPEGFMAKQTADRLEANAVTEAGPFMEYVRANNMEGFLFPTTYHFAKGLPARSVAHHMHMEFRRRVEPVFASVRQERFMLKQVVTLASIIQREARVVDEMPMIAAVYRNRLRKRMRLDADPTVQYALGNETGQWKQGLRYKHLEVRSLYNTYLYFGLPPGPICSPGVDAVRAALLPAETDALYFVADNDGRHIFSRTLKEHNRAREKVKRERLRQRRSGKK